jgi:hypothetical protein
MMCRPKTVISYLDADLRHLAPDFMHRKIDLAPHHQIVAALRAQAAQMRQHHAADLIEQRAGVVPLDQLALLFADPDAQQRALAATCSASAAARGDRARSLRRCLM